MRRTGWMAAALLALCCAWSSAHAIEGNGQRLNARQRTRDIRAALLAQVNAQVPALEQKWGPMGTFGARDISFRTKKAPGGASDLRTVTYSIVRREGWGGTAEARTRISGGEQTTTLFGFVLNVPDYAGPPPGAMSDLGPGTFGSALGR